MFLASQSSISYDPCAQMCENGADLLWTPIESLSLSYERFRSFGAITIDAGAEIFGSRARHAEAVQEVSLYLRSADDAEVGCRARGTSFCTY